MKSRNIKYEDIWSEYAKADIKPYKQFIIDNEIEEMIVKSCPFNKMDVCIQDCFKIEV